LYIGADPNKQNHAAIKIDRRQRWERLDRKAADLKRWISRKEAELESLRRELAAIHADRESWQKYQISEKDKIHEH
jgi:predicted RNase H-like nuclease (RuvC/YqgF family)